MTRKYEDYSVEPDGMLIDGAGREISDFKDILAQRDDLLAALKAAPCHKAVNFNPRAPEPSDFWVERYTGPDATTCPRCAAIAKVEGR